MTKYIGLMLFPIVEELDFVGPYETFGMLRMQDPDWRAVLIAQDGKPVKCGHGLTVQADHSFDDAPPLDVILVPGGMGTRTEVNNPVLIDYVRRQAERCEWVTSVCTGALILQKAGLLSGRRATTHWAAIGEMRAAGGGVEVVEDERWVRDGNVITAAGVSAGIDMALYLVSLLKDASAAVNAQKMMEYYPKPPQFEEVSA